MKTKKPKGPKPAVERKLGRERAHGQSWPDGLVEIDQRTKGLLRLEILIHEYLHNLFYMARNKKLFKVIVPDSVEETIVETLSPQLALALWRNKVRIVDEA